MYKANKPYHLKDLPQSEKLRLFFKRASKKQNKNTRNGELGITACKTKLLMVKK